MQSLQWIIVHESDRHFETMCTVKHATEINLKHFGICDDKLPVKSKKFAQQAHKEMNHECI